MWLFCRAKRGGRGKRKLLGERSLAHVNKLYDWAAEASYTETNSARERRLYADFLSSIDGRVQDGLELYLEGGRLAKKGIVCLASLSWRAI